MKSKRRLLEKSRLYVIVDKDNCKKRSLFEIAKKIKNGGADIIQYRDKSSHKECILENALRLKDLIKESKPRTFVKVRGKPIFIVNDYLDVAKIIDSDGLHLGQGDIPIEIARKILGKDRIIGISCHSLKEALKAQRKGADYIGIGPVFQSSTKISRAKRISLDLIKKLKKRIKIPFFAIGGINQDNIKPLLSDVRGVAISCAICRARNPYRATEYFLKALKR